jgi:hypothetical protein
VRRNQIHDRIYGIEPMFESRSAFQMQLLDRPQSQRVGLKNARLGLDLDIGIDTGIAACSAHEIFKAERAGAFLGNFKQSRGSIFAANEQTIQYRYGYTGRSNAHNDIPPFRPHSKNVSAGQFLIIETLQEIESSLLVSHRNATCALEVRENGIKASRGDPNQDHGQTNPKTIGGPNQPFGARVLESPSC